MDALLLAVLSGGACGSVAPGCWVPSSGLPSGVRPPFPLPPSCCSSKRLCLPIWCGRTTVLWHFPGRCDRSRQLCYFHAEALCPLPSSARLGTLPDARQVTPVLVLSVPVTHPLLVSQLCPVLRMAPFSRWPWSPAGGLPGSASGPSFILFY